MWTTSQMMSWPRSWRSGELFHCGAEGTGGEHSLRRYSAGHRCKGLGCGPVGGSARTGQAVAPRQHGIPSVCKAMALHSRGRDVCLPPFHACSCASLRPTCHRCAIAPSYAAKLVLVQGELQRRRSASNVFAGRHGFITPRDLFRCGCGSWQGLFSSLALGARENSLLLLTAGRCGVWQTCVT